MRVQSVQWKTISRAQRKIIPSPIGDLFSDAVAQGLQPRFFLVRLSYGEKIIDDKKFNLASAQVENDDQDARRFVQAVEQGRVKPIGISLNKTLEVTRPVKTTLTTRQLPQTLIYPGDFIGLWEALVDLKGSWIVRAGCTRILIPRRVANGNIWDKVKNGINTTHLKWGPESELNFLSVIADEKASKWACEVLLFDKNILSQAGPLHTALGAFLFERTTWQLRHRLVNSAKGEIISGVELDETKAFYRNLEFAISSIITGSEYGYYLSGIACENDETDVDLPMKAIVDPYAEYFGRANGSKEKEGHDGSHIPVFIPCLNTAQTLRRSRGKLYRFFNLCGSLGVDFDERLPELLRHQCGTGPLATPPIPAFSRVERNESILFERLSKLAAADDELAKALKVPRFTEVRLKKNEVPNNGVCIARFFYRPGDRKHEERLDVMNGCQPRWIPLTYQQGDPLTAVRFEGFPPTLVWSLQVDTNP